MAEKPYWRAKFAAPQTAIERNFAGNPEAMRHARELVETYDISESEAISITIVGQFNPHIEAKTVAGLTRRPVTT